MKEQSMFEKNAIQGLAHCQKSGFCSCVNWKYALISHAIFTINACHLDLSDMCII